MLTKPDDQQRLGRFYVKMRTPAIKEERHSRNQEATNSNRLIL